MASQSKKPTDSDSNSSEDISEGISSVESDPKDVQNDGDNDDLDNDVADTPTVKNAKSTKIPKTVSSSDVDHGALVSKSMKNLAVMSSDSGSDTDPEPDSHSDPDPDTDLDDVPEPKKSADNTKVQGSSSKPKGTRAKSGNEKDQAKPRAPKRKVTGTGGGRKKKPEGGSVGKGKKSTKNNAGRKNDNEEDDMLLDGNKAKKQARGTKKKSLLIFFENAEGLNALTKAMNIVTGDELHMTCNPSGIRFQSINSAHVIFVDIKLDAEKFDDYMCPEEMSFVPPTKSIAKLCGLFDVCSNATLYTEGPCPKHITMIFDNVLQESTRMFDTVLNPSNPELEFRDIDPGKSAHVRMFSDELMKICESFSTVMNDSVTIKVTKDTLEFSARSSDPAETIKTMRTRFIDKNHMFNGEDAFETVYVACVENVEQEFSLAWLKVIASAKYLSPTVSLRMENGIPMCVEYDVCVKPSRHKQKSQSKSAQQTVIGTARFFLSPTLPPSEC